VKLVLGTAQFGLPYGATNVRGVPAKPELVEILSTAKDEGIEVLDTAAEYGCSEESLGQSAGDHAGFRYITKTLQFNGRGLGREELSSIKNRFAKSLSNLRVERVFGLLVHNVEDCLAKGGEQLVELLIELRDTGKAERIGISVYDPGQIEAALKLFIPDVIQLPFNVLDQKLLREGYLRGLKEKGIEVHARSAFLQGILLLDPDRLPSHFEPWRLHLQRYRNVLRERGITAMQAALSFVLQKPEIDLVVVGVTSAAELREIALAARQRVDVSFLQEFAINDPRLTNPLKWDPTSSRLTAPVTEAIH
jgi:aryl-alcohol dehydrogenase-like predicted oxidoreductase